MKCGKRPPEPGRTRCEPCAAKKRPADRARHHRRTAERVDRGLCPKCGKRPPAPGRSQCEPCLEKDRAAGQARDARLRAAGIPRRDCEKAREYERERERRQTERRRAEGLCTSCGNAPAAPGRVSCEPCQERRRAKERRRYAARRAAGLCTNCGTPAFDAVAYCGPCAVIRNARRPPERRNDAARLKYAERRARGQCTDCGEPSQGAARCVPCAERSYHRSAHFRGIPLWDPSWTVIEIATGEMLGTFDSEADVALCLVFEKLARDQVEVLCDASPMSSYTAWT